MVIDAGFGSTSAGDARRVVCRFTWRRSALHGDIAGIVAHLFVDEVFSHSTLNDGLVAFFLHGGKRGIQQILFFRRKRLFHVDF